MRMKVGEIAAAVGGVLMADAGCQDAEVIGVSWDSRTVESGYLYVALPGERVDGHDFIESAFEAGAVCALVTREWVEDTAKGAVGDGAPGVCLSSEITCSASAPEQKDPQKAPEVCSPSEFASEASVFERMSIPPAYVGKSLIAVDDTAKAFTQLAAYWRTQLQGVVLGLTGSTGKTTTKGLVRDVLAAAGSVVATQANQNNELGVPNTLLAAERDTREVVVEMGMRGLGQIGELCAVAKPDWGLITNVGESHMELLGTRDNIGRAKAELFASLPGERGIAFVNAADDYAAQVIEWGGLRERGVHIVYFDGRDRSRSAEQDRAYSGGAPTVWAQGISFDAQGCPCFTMHADGFTGCGFAPAMECECRLQLRGIHNVSNACSAAAVGLAAGLSLEACCAALGQAAPEAGRGQFLRSPQGTLVVNDAYNANPDSMKAALATFGALEVPGRRIAVLGDMGELGDLAPEAHTRVGCYAAAAGLDLLICVGELARFIAEGARSAGMSEGSVVLSGTLEEALGLLEAEGPLGADDAVLAKASHFMEFEKIVERLVG